MAEPIIIYLPEEFTVINIFTVNNIKLVAEDYSVDFFFFQSQTGKRNFLRHNIGPQEHNGMIFFFVF